MKTVHTSELAELVQGELEGDGSLLIEGFAPIDTAGPKEISFIADQKKMHLLEKSRAGAVLVPFAEEMSFAGALIRVKNPNLAGAIIHNFFQQKPFKAKGIDPRAAIGENCKISGVVTISPFAVVGDGAIIGERVFVGPGAVIGEGVMIGADCCIHANVTIYAHCLLGEKVIVHSGTVIGADGYGYAVNERGEHIKRPQVGIVRIEDDVEIGANSCIDRATFGETVIGRGTKIDNLVQVAHNVEVGENCLLVSQVGISGSTVLGRNVVMGGQSATAGHVRIADQTMIAARAAIHSNTSKGAVLGGTPAIPAKQWAKCCAVYNRLPEMQRQLRKNSKIVQILMDNK